MADGSFTHPGLGKLTRVPHGWRFTFPLGRGREGRFTVMTATPDARPSAECLAAVRAYVRWFRGNDTRLRALIADKMFAGWQLSWYDPDIDRTRTRLGFQRKVNLAGINFYWDEGWVSLVYNDGGLFGGHGIELPTTLAGDIKGDPTMFG